MKKTMKTIKNSNYEEIRLVNIEIHCLKLPKLTDHIYQYNLKKKPLKLLKKASNEQNL